jgi:hypothetical protein
MVSQLAAQKLEQWPIDKLVFYARNPRKNDAAVDRMCGSIREFGFKIPVLARSGTLEDFCRRYWRMDPAAFRSLVQRECPEFSVFLAKFEFEDTARAVE